MRLALKISKHTVIQSSSLTLFAGSTKSDMKTWYPIITQLFTWQRSSEASTSTMYLRTSPAKHVCRCTGISRCFLGSSSRSGRESTHLQSWLVLSKTRPRKWTDSSREPSSQETLETSTGAELRDWRFLYIYYALYGILSDDPNEAAVIKRKAPKFYYNVITGTLYRRSRDGILLRCLSHIEAQETLKVAYDGMCGANQPGPKLGDRLCFPLCLQRGKTYNKSLRS